MLDRPRFEALGIDTEEGLAYCAEDLEFYEEMLEEYADEASHNATDLQQAYGEGDWQRYRIRAHSIKNTSRMIGADTMSERAHALELAAKESDVATIRASHAAFARDYDTLANAIRALLA